MKSRTSMILVNVLLALALVVTPTFQPAEATIQPHNPLETRTALAVADSDLAAPDLADDPLATPVSVSLQQSTFDPAAAAAGLVITVTVRNNLGPVVAPPIVAGDSITDTIAALRSVDFAADPNTLRDVIVSDLLTHPSSDLLGSTPVADQSGDRFVINLGDVPPLGTAQAVLRISAPGALANFAELDSGLTARGNWQGRPVSAAASPISLAPSGFAQWLVCTVDANCGDRYVLRQTNALAGDPSALFQFVRGLGYETYIGSLRGARGTLWSEAGNGVDQASTLIALLRAAGIPAAYRLGTLSSNDAQTLLAGMFDDRPATGGYVPAGQPVADPVNDPALIAEAQQHAWVEAYLPGSGWTAMDPSFPTAQPGDVFGVPSGGQLAELPDSLRHKVSFDLAVEKYRTFPVGATNLYDVPSPVSATYNTVELVGEPVIFSHLVESNTPGGMVYTTAEHTYTPYFVVGEREQLIEGASFGELISNFPFAQDFVVAEWLDITVTEPGGASETYRRELFDDIGYDARVGGGLVGDIGRDETARVSTLSSWATMVATSRLPGYAIDDAYQNMVTIGLDVGDAWDAVSGLGDSSAPTPEITAASQQAVKAFGKAARLGQKLHLYKFLRASDTGLDYLTDSLRIKGYAATPRVFTLGWERNEAEETDAMSFDLGRNRMRALGYPGQTDAGVQSFNYARGMLDLSLEHTVLEEVSPAPVTSVIAVLDQAELDGIPVSRYTVGSLDELNALPISAQAKARISTALTADPDLNVLVPEAMVTLPGAAAPTIGWLQIDSNTLETIDVMENGLHMAVSYAVLGNFAKKVGSLIGGFGAGFVATTMGFWGSFFGQVPIDPADIASVMATSKAAAAAKGKEAEQVCKAKADKKWCKAGVTAGAAAGNAALAKADPPLPEMQLNLPFDVAYPSTSASALVNQTTALTGATVSVNVTTPLVGVHRSLTETWASAARNSFAFDSLSAGNTQVFQGLTLLGSGAVTAAPASPSAPATATSNGAAINVSASTAGSLSLHGPALAQLGAGSNRDAYTASLSGGSSYELTLRGAVVSVGGTDYTGDLRLVTSGAVTLAGAGPTAAPNFSGIVVVNTSNGGFTAAAASGTATVGGNSQPVGNGFALGDAAGSGSIAGAAGANDTFLFNGTADFYRLGLSNSASGIPAGGSVNFSANVSANVSDAYTMTVYGPAGWDVSIDTGGQITAQSPVDATAGAHEIVVFAQPAGAPDLAVSAVHVVTVNPVNSVQLDVAVDPTYTVPWGDTVPGVYDLAVNDGRMQLTGASFAVDLTNASSVDRIYDVVVSGLPAGWSILGSAPGATSLAMPLRAGEKVRLGLHILPTVTTLPPSGTNYPFTVTATAQDNGAVTDSDSDSWTLPAVPFPFVQVSPAEQYLGENSASSFDVTLTNVGNAPGSFDLLATAPAAGWTVSSPASPVALNPGQSSTQTLNLTVTSGQRNVDYPFVLSSPAPTIAYTPTTAMLVYLAGPQSAPVYEAGAQVLACTDASALAAAFNSLGGAASELEASCDGGGCSNGLRDSTVAAANALVSLTNASWPAVSTAAVAADAGALASASGNAAISAALQDLSDSAAALGVAICQSAQHQPAAQFTPSIDAALLGSNAVYTLTVTNEGSVATTYAVTTTLPTGPDFDSLALDPGESQPVVYSFTPAALGFVVLEADVVATGPDVIGDVSDQASAGLNVVTQFVQITSVTPDPPFVETGASSTTVSIDVANVANLRREVTARTTILNAGGGTAFTDDMPLTVQPGAPQSYDLQTVNTSGWASGVYTVEVELLDAALALVPDGYGFAPFGVGQALGASHSVYPLVVAPGDVTVTTVITTEILVDTILPEQPALPPMEARNVRAGEQWVVTKEAGGEVVSAADTSGESLTLTPALSLRERGPEPEPEAEAETAATEAEMNEPAAEEVVDEVIPDNGRSLLAAVARAEQTDGGFTYTGSWQTLTVSRASGNTYARSRTAGHAVSYDFSGPWVTLGLFGTSNSGRAELFIDGVSHGVLDLYRREDTAFSLTFDSLISTTHTISMTVLGTHNPKSTDNYVGVDFVDTWDGAALPDGTFEQTDPRVLLSGGWSNVNDANASGGSYLRSSTGNAWFPFSGDSFTYRAMTRGAAHTVRLFVDGAYLTELDQFDWDNVPRSFSFQGFGPGLHVVQVSNQNGEGTVDAFTQPGSAPWTDPSPPAASFQRYEADDSGWLYNSDPLTVTARTWTRENNSISNNASVGETVWSATASDNAARTVTGRWAAIGFLGHDDAGSAEVFLDGVSQGVVSTYRNEVEPVSFTIGNFITGTHTISIAVVGDGEVNIDYLDVWDGTALPDGAYDWSDFDRFTLDDNWSLRTSISPPGQFLRSSTGNAWFPFTGDTVSYQGWNDNTVRTVRLFVDDSYKGDFDLGATMVPTPTWSFDGLGAGAHVLRLQSYQPNGSIGAFIQPGSAPFYAPPAIGAFHRYEEDWPAILYNGSTFTETVTTWTRVNNSNASNASAGQVVWSNTVGDTASLAFSGVAVGVGFLADRFSGSAEIFIDSVSQGVIDLYRRDVDYTSVYYDGLAPGAHTITVTVLGVAHPNGSGASVNLDFIDVWDGTPLPDGAFEEFDNRVLRSYGWYSQTEAGASGGAYARENIVASASMWFPFSGDSVSFQAMARSDGGEFAIAKIDGQFVGYLNLYNASVTPRVVSFDGLGAGLHVLHLQRYRGELTVDKFTTPGSAPFFTPPIDSGFVRYEENHPAMRYNGYSYAQTPQTWWPEDTNGRSSGGYTINSSTSGNVASLQFNGSWLTVGFRTRSNGGQAEVFVDSVSQGVVGLYNAGEGIVEVQIDGLSPGPHTVEVVVLGIPDPPSTATNVWLDYIEVYDDSATSDNFQNANRGQRNGRVHLSDYFGTYPDANGIEGDYTEVGIGAPAANAWYSFLGDSFTFYGFTDSNDPQVDIFIDGVLAATVSMDYDFSDTPLAFHFTGLPFGPHAVRVTNVQRMRVDGFAANPPNTYPYAPMVEWYDDAPAGNGAPFFGSVGMVSGMAAGDINNDGVVELVFGSDTLSIWGKLFVYRADGQDAGGGTPLIWTDDIGGAPVNRALIGSIALAELDGQPNSEIVVHSSKDLRVYHADGTLWWSNATLKGFDLLGAPAIGNLDADPEPEIVTNADKTLAVLDGDGTLLWSTTFAQYVVPPMLADMTGDGLLDIIAADYGDGAAGTPTQVRLYDYNLGTPSLVWSVPITPAIRTSGLNGLLGSHAVGDIDGQQPGGDPGPEIVISHNGNVTVLDADGSVVWTVPLEPGNPGGVSIADIDGDGEVEIVTGMKHEFAPGQTGKLYALNADGSLLWDAIAEDGTSANSASVLDLNGDGIYEVAWTGREQGFTIYDGATGDVVFYEPLVYSITGSDHPIIIDADNDGQAEIVAASLRGPRVFGMGGAWTNSRPLWNQQTYHITNVNDDLSIPAAEANSWEVHNTYRTQTSQPQPLPVFGIDLTHTVGINNVTVLTGTFSIPPTAATDPDYRWDFAQTAAEEVLTRTFDSLLTFVQPGEARMVAQGTEVFYTLGSGSNTLHLPPLWVAAPHIIALTPETQNGYAGSTASFDVVLTNPAASADVYTLAVSSLPAEWSVSLPGNVAIAAGATMTETLLIQLPQGALGSFPLTVAAENGAGGTDQASGSLQISDALDIAVSPGYRESTEGVAVQYTVVVTNNTPSGENVALAVTGLDDHAVGLASSLAVPANGSANTTLTVTPQAGPRAFGFAVTGTAASGAADSAQAVLDVVGLRTVDVSIDPASAAGGPGTPAQFTVTVTNSGTLSDTYTLDVTLPGGWSHELTRNGETTNSVSLRPLAFNSAQLLLTVTPPLGAPAGNVPVSVSAESTELAGVQGSDSAQVQVLTRGVTAAISPQTTNLSPAANGLWSVTVTNRGSVADTYNLSVGGALAGTATLTPSSVSLLPGASRVVQLSSGPLPFQHAGPSQFSVTAQSTGDSRIRGEDAATINFSSYEAVNVAWEPESQTVSSLSATFTLFITNTGNIATTYTFDVAGAGLTAEPQLAQFSIPAHSSVANLVTLTATDVGTFPFTGTASSTSSPASDSAGGTLIITCPGDPDVDGDGDVTVLDITAVAERWELPGSYSALYDLNCNGVIDIVDIQTAAGAFGS